MNKGIIYLWTNEVNGKMYVGQTIHEERRKQEHNRGKHRKPQVIDKAIAKYGTDNFSYRVLAVLKAKDNTELKKLMNEAEIFFIDYYQTFYKTGKGYNMTKGGGGTIGFEHSESTKKKLSEQKTGIKLTAAQRQRISEGHKGLKKTESHKAALSLAHEKDKKAVMQLTLDGKLVKTYESIKAASAATGINKGNISATIRGKQKQTKGFLWVAA